MVVTIEVPTLEYDLEMLQIYPAKNGQYVRRYASVACLRTSTCTAQSILLTSIQYSSTTLRTQQDYLRSVTVLLRVYLLIRSRCTVSYIACKAMYYSNQVAPLLELS
jgi:hypothetical protein